MKTLETLGPVVKEGKGILDQFKGYFDKDVGILEIWKFEIYKF